jgi:hypothetical protein
MVDINTSGQAPWVDGTQPLRSSIQAISIVPKTLRAVTNCYQDGRVLCQHDPSVTSWIMSFLASYATSPAQCLAHPGLHRHQSLHGHSL